MRVVLIPVVTMVTDSPIWLHHDWLVIIAYYYGYHSKKSTTYSNQKTQGWHSEKFCVQQAGLQESSIKLTLYPSRRKTNLRQNFKKWAVNWA